MYKYAFSLLLRNISGVLFVGIQATFLHEYKNCFTYSRSSVLTDSACGVFIDSTYLSLRLDAFIGGSSSRRVTSF